MFCDISDADWQRTSADVHHDPSELPGLKKPLKVQMKTEGSVSDLIGQQQQLTSETGRALKNTLGELINLKEVMMKSVQDVELQLKQITEQFYQEKTAGENVESGLLEAQEELAMTSGDDSPVATKHAERLNSHVNKLSSCLHTTDEEKIDMEVEMVELIHHLEEVIATLKTLQYETNSTTAKLHGQLKEVIDSLKKATLKIADKENKLRAQENDKKVLQMTYVNAQAMIEQFENELSQANDRVQQITELQLQAAGYEKQLHEAREQLVQETGKNADLGAAIRALYEEKTRIQQESSNRIRQLQDILLRREMNERRLTQQVEKAEEAVKKAAEDAIIQKKSIHPREIRCIRSEELSRTAVESERHSSHIHDKDSTSSDYAEAGIFTVCAEIGRIACCLSAMVFSRIH